MGNISTHVLDTSLGRPAEGMRVTLAIRENDHEWKTLASVLTDADGRAGELLPASLRLIAGTYRLSFDTAAYFRAQNREVFFPQVDVVFSVRCSEQHFHVPLLLTPYSYCTYRGS